MKFLIVLFLPASPFIPISLFINFRDFYQPPRLLHPPRLLFWPRFASLPIYSPSSSIWNSRVLHKIRVTKFSKGISGEVVFSKFLTNNLPVFRTKIMQKHTETTLSSHHFNEEHKQSISTGKLFTYLSIVKGSFVILKIYKFKHLTSSKEWYH